MSASAPVELDKPAEHLGVLEAFTSLEDIATKTAISWGSDLQVAAESASSPETETPEVIIISNLESIEPRKIVQAASDQQFETDGSINKVRVPSYSYNTEEIACLPSFIRPLPSRLTSEDITILFHKGALEIEGEQLRDELLRSYVEYIHPFMPILDLEAFISPIVQNDGSQQISLFLFQAVMFAAVASVDIRVLRSAGYDNRKTARKAFFRRARTLYDLDVELDSLALIQGVLLMTYWFESPEDQKNTWHWIGIALSLAQTLGMHRNFDENVSHHGRKRLYKRIWWSCWMRDKFSALALRRPVRISDGDHDVSMLTLSDFEDDVLPDAVLRMLGSCPSVRIYSLKIELAKLCIEKAKLSRYIGQILTMAQANSIEEKVWNTVKQDQQLEDWHRHQLESDNQYDSFRNLSGHAVLNLHRATLEMAYLTSSMFLHLPLSMNETYSSQLGSHVRDYSKRQVRVTASEISSIAQDLHRQNLGRFLPPSGVTFLLPAVIIHLQDIKSGKGKTRGQSLEGIHDCMRILLQLSDIYASADFAIYFLQTASRKSGISLVVPPLQSDCKAVVRSQLVTESGVSNRQPQSKESSLGNPTGSSTTVKDQWRWDASTTTPAIMTPVSPTASCIGETVTTASPSHEHISISIEELKEGFQNDFDILFDFDGSTGMFDQHEGLNFG